MRSSAFARVLIAFLFYVTATLVADFYRAGAVRAFAAGQAGHRRADRAAAALPAGAGQENK